VIGSAVSGLIAGDALHGGLCHRSADRCLSAAVTWVRCGWWADAAFARGHE
jgi:hypothetical protein